MKKLVMICVLVLVTGIIFPACSKTSSAVEAVEVPTIEPTITVQPTPQKDLSLYKEYLASDFIPDLDELANASQYSITLTIADEINKISASQKIIYTNNETEPLKNIYFLLLPNVGGDYLQVESVKVDGISVKSNMEYQNTALKIDLYEPLNPGRTVLISMDFSAVVPEEMGGNYGLYIFQENILALDSFFPIIPVYDDEGWNVQDPPRNGDLIFTDAAFFDVEVTAPKNLILAASGILQDTQRIEGRQVVRFIGGPQRDFYLAASPGFLTISDKPENTRITSFFPKGLRDSGEFAFQTAQQALRVFSGRYGSYPYNEFDLVSTPMLAGGMEYSGAVAVALELYGSENTPANAQDRIFLEYAIAHEVAHQWFFNQVMNDQIDEPWLDEALAQYLTYIYFLDTYGSDAAEQARASWEMRWSRVKNEPIPVGMPANDYEPDQYSPIIYGRGPLFVLELERQMGEKVFTRFLRDYVKVYRWKNTDTEQFKSLAEETCNCDLTALFNEWWAVK